jgi:hypothetical protein
MNKLIRIRFAHWAHAIDISEILAKDGFGVSVNVYKNGKGATLKARRIKGTLVYDGKSDA